MFIMVVGTMADDRWSLPPEEKIYEAYSAVADGRVKIYDGYAAVASSDNKKEYTVEWDNDIYSSNDNASYWQGYMGYPLIAVLMLQGKLSYDKTVPECFVHINWKQLNTEYKNEYGKAVSFILERLASEGRDVARIQDDVRSVFEQIKQIDIKRKRGKKSPPKSR